MAQSSPPTEPTVESKDIGVIESSELGIYTTPRRTTMEKVKLERIDARIIFSEIPAARAGNRMDPRSHRKQDRLLGYSGPDFSFRKSAIFPMPSSLRSNSLPCSPQREILLSFGMDAITMPRGKESDRVLSDLLSVLFKI